MQPKLGSRRGVAMVMVMVCVVVCIVVASLALSTNDATPDLSENASANAEANWAATSNINLAVAALQTAADWTDGDKSLFASSSFGDATITITDLDGNAPDDQDTDVILTASVNVNGITAEKKAVVRITPSVPPAEAIDPWLNEFTAFASNQLVVETETALLNWSQTPGNRSAPVKLGLGFNSAANLDLSTSAIVSSAEVYADVSASASLKAAVAANPLGKGVALQLPLPKVPEKLPGDFLLIPLRALFHRWIDETTTTLAHGIYAGVTIEDDSVVTLDAASGSHWSFNALTLTDDSVLKIKGDVRAVVRGKLTISDESTIVLSDASSSLLLYTMDDVEITNAAVGVEAWIARNSSRSHSHIGAYMKPSRIRIVGVASASGGKAAPVFTMNQRSLACAAIHAPTASVTFNGESTLVGRVSAGSLAIRGRSKVIGDPSLDRGVGFSNVKGPLYKSDGSPLDGLATAIKTYNPLLGVDALVAFVVGSLGPEPTITAAPGVTPRSSGRASPTHVASAAFSLEGKPTAIGSATIDDAE